MTCSRILFMHTKFSTEEEKHVLESVIYFSNYAWSYKQVSDYVKKKMKSNKSTRRAWTSLAKVAHYLHIALIPNWKVSMVI